MKHRLRKARNLINRYKDSWGSQERLFKLRSLNKRYLRQEAND